MTTDRATAAASRRARCPRAPRRTPSAGRCCSPGSTTAKLRLRELYGRRELTELEEAWLVRSLYREDGVAQPEIARRMGRHKSWVWRRLMLVESLDPDVQANVRLGLIAARAAVAVSRLPCGNQQAATGVVIRRGLTVRQTDLLVAEILEESDVVRREALLARRLAGPTPGSPPGPRPSRATLSEADRMAADILRIHALVARLEARLLATPLTTFVPAATELMRDALARLSPVLRARRASPVATPASRSTCARSVRHPGQRRA